MDPLTPLITSLRAEGRLRVWSLVMTAFGDLVQHRGGAVSTARLGVLLERIGVERGALRTALSRLGSDGWLTREREGRTSICRLSPQGLAQFGPATSAIYAAPRGPVESWTMTARIDDNGAPVVHLRPAPDDLSEADCAVSGRLERITPAFQAAFLTEAYRESLAALAGDLRQLPADRSASLEAAAARLLLIHRWRRIVLRYPEPWPQLLPENAPLTHPRAEVAAAYARLAGPAEAWLDSALPTDPPMPPGAPEFATRFGLHTQA